MSPDRKLDESLERLAAQAQAADAGGVWPTASWDALRESGALTWCIPTEYGGSGLEGPAILSGYERLAGACLTTCFILSQRDSACRRLRESKHDALCGELLPALAAGKSFATVGLSQLTTSRQHTAPALRAELRDDRVILDGTVPWVTGASRADHVVVGGTLEDGRQILAIMPRGARGAEIEPSLPLMALEGSMTAQVRCRNVELDRHWLLAGPAERVMGSGRGGTGGVETSCLALGLAGAAIEYLKGETSNRGDLGPITERLEQSRHAVRAEMHALVQRAYTPAEAAALRARANSLVLRATQAALTASKGTGFLRDHPAQRWARQALFFLVWSCPRPAAEATLDSLIPAEDCLFPSLDDGEQASCN
jgi:alkylation response protein AidB-like acyl-CoA dehydrogenase